MPVNTKLIVVWLVLLGFAATFATRGLADDKTSKPDNSTVEKSTSNSGLSRWEFSQVHMGTRFRISLYASNRVIANDASTDAYAIVEELNAIFSDYEPGSEVRRLCGTSGPITVSRPLLDVLLASQKLSRRSEGAFDVTVGPSVALWRTARKKRELPTPDQIKLAQQAVDYQFVKVNRADQTVQLQRTDVRIDLGAIAKGYAADAALKILGKHGVKSALIDAGGDIVCSDAPPGKDAWVIAVGSEPTVPGSKRQLIQIENCAVATSGDQFQFVEIAGKRYSHIVDPRTGMGMTKRRNVTVIARNGMDADGLASALSVMGKAGFKLLPDYSASALICGVAPGDVTASSEFKNYHFEIPARHPKTTKTR